MLSGAKSPLHRDELGGGGGRCRITGVRVELSRRTSLFVPLGLWVLLAGIRMLAPSTLDDKDQPKVAFYTQDILERGRCVLQYSDGVDVMTKPPLYQWTAAGLAKALGGLNEFTLLLPSLLASLGILFLVWDWGRMFGRSATAVGYVEDERREDNPGRHVQASGGGYGLACLAALIWAATYHVQRLEWTARTDMMVTAFGLGAIWASGRLQGARESGAGEGRRAVWRWTFWGLIALGALTKGQVAVGVALGAVGMECAVRRSWRPLTDLQPWFGLPIVAGVFALWFNAAYEKGGQEFWDTLVGNEFLQRVAGTGERKENARPVWYFVPIFLGRFLPWSAVLALSMPRWIRERVWRRDHPFAVPAAWLVGIFLVFSLPAGKRPDYILPAYAPGAVLAAVVVMDWLWRGWRALGWKKQGEGKLKDEMESTAKKGIGHWGWLATARGRLRLLAVVFVAGALGNAGYFHFGSEAARTHRADRTREFGEAAYRVVKQSPGPIVYYDSKNSLVQFYLHTNQDNLDLEETVERLRELAGEEYPGPVYVVTRTSRVERLREALGAGWRGEVAVLLEGVAPEGRESALVLVRVYR